MLFPTLRLLGQPQWLAEHLQLYAALGHVEAALAWRTLVARAAWAFAALGAAVVTFNLVGMAGLLIASGVVDLAPGRGPFAMGMMALVAALPALGAAGAWHMARRPMPPWFSHLRAQAAEDWRLWQAQGAGQTPEAAAQVPAVST
ncbi:MAG: hypothetical protein H6933_01615 [Burkholderiaceae bacterium]|nr:hypothetical protein [Rhodoferax sp.]MCP5283577.1 hypothetical protein [Burkholderiaceae bacterium]